ncbi:MAG: phage tail terminator-like protein [Pseudomonadota bacterium]
MPRFTETQRALDVRLGTYAGAEPIAWPNVTFEPEEDQTWIRPQHLPNTPRKGLNRNTTTRGQGFYQIDIFAPADQGDGPAVTLADQIAALFPEDDKLQNGSTTVVLGVPAQDVAGPSGAWYRVAVLIPYQSFTK